MRSMMPRLSGVFLLVLTLGLAACGGSSSPSNNTQPTTAPATATAKPAGSGHYQVGQTGHVGIWDVTVNSAKTSAGDANDTPTNGQYLILDITFKNTDTTDHDISSILQFSFKDATTGQLYQDQLTQLPGVTPPDSDVQGGDLVRGQVVYDVPTSAHAFEWTFASVLTPAVGVWDITV